MESPPFQSMVRASGLGEVWTHTHDDLKFNQFGWRCTNKENCYDDETLVGNWNEERFDVKTQSKAKRLPSQFEHYFETTCGASFNYKPHEVPKELKHLKERHPHAFPGHQPELDHPSLKKIYNSWETTTRAGYVDPRIRMQQIAAPSQGAPEPETVPLSKEKAVLM